MFGLIGKRRLPNNPRFCKGCFLTIGQRRGGVEIPCSSLFADVRGSTPLAERLGPTRFHELMDRFYRVGVAELVNGGALVDRFLGDEVIGYFVPGFAPEHARSAIESALALLRATGNVAGQEAWVSVGAGVHSGRAFVGNLGTGDQVTILSALGEDISIAARLASLAQAGELLVSETAFVAAGIGGDPERRELELKGVTTPVPARVLRVSAESHNSQQND